MKQVLDILSYSTKKVDVIIAETRLSIPAVQYLLLECQRYQVFMRNYFSQSPVTRLDILMTILRYLQSQMARLKQPWRYSTFRDISYK